MIHIITGNTGAGKTTYAHELKKSTNGVIFSIDQWNSTLFLMNKEPGDGLEWFLERINRAEELIMNLVCQMEESKTDSILDLGFSKKVHRDKFRKFAESNGFEIIIHFLDVPRDIRLKRVLQRNEEQGDTFEFEVSMEDFNFMEDWFEKPTAAELAGGNNYIRKSKIH